MKDGELSWIYNLNGLYDFFDPKINVPDFMPAFDRQVLLVHAQPSAFVDDYDYVRSMMPNVEFSAIAGGDHNLHKSHPDELLARIVEFVNRKTKESGETNEGSEANETDENE